MSIAQTMKRIGKDSRVFDTFRQKLNIRSQFGKLKFTMFLANLGYLGFLLPHLKLHYLIVKKLEIRQTMSILGF